MNLHNAYLILTLIAIVKLKFSEGKKVAFVKRGPLTDIKNKHRYYRLDTPKFDNYYKLLSRPYVQQYLLKLFKTNRHIGEAKPFVDLTRDNLLDTASYGNVDKFSEDYIDISELARYAQRQSNHKKITDKIKPKEKNVFMDIHGNSHQVLKILDLIARRMVQQQRRKAQSDNDESSSDSDSDDEDTISEESKKDILKNKARSGFIPKRFHVVNNNSGETKSDSDNDENTVNVPMESDSEVENNNKRYQASKRSDSESDEDSASNGVVYVQSPTRHLKNREVEWRRRLKHFLPKRVHWDENEFHKLKNYWISGPRGRYPAPYKTPY